MLITLIVLLLVLVLLDFDRWTASRRNQPTQSSDGPAKYEEKSVHHYS